MTRSSKKINRTVKLAKSIKRSAFAAGGNMPNNDFFSQYAMDTMKNFPKGGAFSPVHILSKPSSDIKFTGTFGDDLQKINQQNAKPLVTSGLVDDQKNPYLGPHTQPAPVTPTSQTGVTFEPPSPPDPITFTPFVTPETATTLTQPTTTPVVNPTSTVPLAEPDLYKGAPLNPTPEPEPEPEPEPVATTEDAPVEQTSGSFEGGGPCCFDPDAPILMADGAWKRIADVVEGDKVTGLKGKVNTVVGVKSTTVGSRKMMQFEGHNFYSTDDHLFLTNNGWKTWVPSRLIDNDRDNAKFLEGENRVVPLNNYDKMSMVVDGVPVEKDYDQNSVKSHDFPADHVVYDLHLDGDQTYIVEGFVVHNCSNFADGGAITMRRYRASGGPVNLAKKNAKSAKHSVKKPASSNALINKALGVVSKKT
jgi:hypothetical protein